VVNTSLHRKKRNGTPKPKLLQKHLNGGRAHMPRGSGLKKVRISFKKVRKMTLGQVFGTKPMAPGDIVKKVWILIKKKKLQKKKKKKDED